MRRLSALLFVSFSGWVGTRERDSNRQRRQYLLISLIFIGAVSYVRIRCQRRFCVHNKSATLN